MQPPSLDRREEIQKRLQLLKDESERERKAFDELAAAHPELPVEEIQELARAKSKAEVPTAIEVAGVTVGVDDYVGTLDDAALLIAAERGYLVRDPVKRVYLGERGKVLRVMPSFQGKPAVELRFADGAVKIFFAECLDVGEQSAKRKASAGEVRGDTVGAEESGRRDAARPPKKHPEDEGDTAVKPPVPTWDTIALARRDSRQTAPRSASVSALIPPPPPTPPIQATGTNAPQSDGSETLNERRPHVDPTPPATTSTTASSAKPLVAPKQPSPRPRNAPLSRPNPVPPASSGGMEEKKKKEAAAAAPKSKSPTVSPRPRDTAAPPARKSPPPSAQPPQRRPSSKAAHAVLSDPPSRQATSGAEERGQRSNNTPATAPAPPAADNAIKARSPVSPAVSAPPPPLASYSVEENQIPKRCPPNYEAKFSFEDKGTRIPRLTAAKPVGVRRCWVAGYVEGETTGPLDFKPVALRENTNSMKTVLAVLSYELSWNHSPDRRARRLFTEEGHEIVRTDAVTDGCRVVATPGNGYSRAAVAATVAAAAAATDGAASGVSSFAASASTLEPASSSSPPSLARPAKRAAAKPQQQPSSPPASNGTAPTERSPSSQTTSAAEAPPAASRTPILRKTRQAAALSKPTAPGQRKASKSLCSVPQTPLSDRLGVTSSVSSNEHTKMGAGVSTVGSPLTSIIHVCVYENGVYDAGNYERVYRTVTIRPTYKTLSSVKTLIARELEWRGGRKVEALFDATGMEITDLGQLRDGSSIVASAGERFIVPYPSSPLHHEAVKLAKVA